MDQLIQMYFIADDPNETNSANVYVVQLPSGVVRDILNLVDNASNYQKEVMVRGFGRLFWTTRNERNYRMNYR